MVNSGWKRSCRGAIALVAVVMVGAVVLAPAAGAGATHERPTFWTHIEWPDAQTSHSRCARDSSYVSANQSPSWSEPVSVTVKIWHLSTGEPGCRPVRESTIEGQLRATTFWVTRDAEQGRLVASGWVPCTGAGCTSRYVKVQVDTWIRHDPTSTTAPGGAIAWGTVSVNGCAVTRGWSDNSETNLVYGPPD